MARYSDDQMALAKAFLHSAVESLAVAFWSSEPRFQEAFERELEAAVAALGKRLVPVTSQPQTGGLK